MDFDAGPDAAPLRLVSDLLAGSRFWFDVPPGEDPVRLARLLASDFLPAAAVGHSALLRWAPRAGVPVVGQRWLRVIPFVEDVGGAPVPRAGVYLVLQDETAALEG